MADAVWSVVCRSSVIDTDTNNISLLNVIEQLGYAHTSADQSEDPDLIGLEMAWVTLWARSQPNKAEIVESRSTLKAPNGDVLWRMEQSVNLKDHRRVRIRHLFQNIKFAGVGRYKFVTHKRSGSGRWTKVAEVPLDIYKTEIRKSTKH